jgi:hypothetical protein
VSARTQTAFVLILIGVALTAACGGGHDSPRPTGSSTPSTKMPAEPACVQEGDQCDRPNAGRDDNCCSGTSCQGDPADTLTGKPGTCLSCLALGDVCEVDSGACCNGMTCDTYSKSCCVRLRHPEAPCSRDDDCCGAVGSTGAQQEPVPGGAACVQGSCCEIAGTDVSCAASDNCCSGQRDRTDPSGTTFCTCT